MNAALMSIKDYYWPQTFERCGVCFSKQNSLNAFLSTDFYLLTKQFIYLPIMCVQVIISH